MVRKRKIKEYENMSFVFNQFNDLVEKVEKDAYNMFYGENYRKHNLFLNISDLFLIFPFLLTMLFSTNLKLVILLMLLTSFAMMGTSKYSIKLRFCRYNCC